MMTSREKLFFMLQDILVRYVKLRNDNVHMLTAWELINNFRKTHTPDISFDESVRMMEDLMKFCVDNGSTYGNIAKNAEPMMHELEYEYREFRKWKNEIKTSR